MVADQGATRWRLTCHACYITTTLDRRVIANNLDLDVIDDYLVNPVTPRTVTSKQEAETISNQTVYVVTELSSSRC